MKKELFIMVVAIASCQSSLRKEETLAQISIENSVFKFDRLLAGDSLRAKFILANRSPETVHILKMGTSCDCTTVNYPDSILSGQTDTVFVQYKSKLIDTGYVERTVVLELNTKKRFQELRISGQVVLE
jgi:hypothetical protein